MTQNQDTKPIGLGQIMFQAGEPFMLYERKWIPVLPIAKALLIDSDERKRRVTTQIITKPQNES